MRSILPLLFSIPLLLGCTLQAEVSQPVSSTPTVVDQNPLPDNIQTQVRTDLANHLSIPTEQITIQGYSRQTWSDGCLGLGGPAELCLAALAEGWQIEAVDVATEEIYIYRTDLNGAQIRREP